MWRKVAGWHYTVSSAVLSIHRYTWFGIMAHSKSFPKIHGIGKPRSHIKMCTPTNYRNQPMKMKHSHWANSRCLIQGKRYVQYIHLRMRLKGSREEKQNHSHFYSFIYQSILFHPNLMVVLCFFGSLPVPCFRSEHCIFQRSRRRIAEITHAIHQIVQLSPLYCMS